MTENRKIILRITVFCIAAIVFISIVAWLSFREKPVPEFSQIQIEKNIEKTISPAEKRKSPVKQINFEEDITEPEEPEEIEPEVIAEEVPEVEPASYIIAVSADESEVQNINKKQASAQSVKPGSVSGYVYDEIGQPIAGAEVRALGRIVDVNLGRGLTDMTGFYKIEDLSSGDYRIEARVLETGFMGDIFISLEKEEIKTEVDITVQAVFKVSGTVYDPDGKPAAGVKIIPHIPKRFRQFDSPKWEEIGLALEDEMSSPYLDQLVEFVRAYKQDNKDKRGIIGEYFFYYMWHDFIYTDVNGKFSILSKEGPIDSLYISDPYFCGGINFPLDGNTEDITINFELNKNHIKILKGAVFNELTKKPMNNFNLRIYSSGFIKNSFALADSILIPLENTQGMFNMEVAFCSSSNNVLVIEADGYAPAVENVCEMHFDKEVCEFLIYLGNGGEASICVKDETDNIPVSGVKVVLIEPWQNLQDFPVVEKLSYGYTEHRTSKTDKNGCAVFEMLAEAEHCFWVLHPGYQPELAGPYDIAAGQRTDIEISLKPCE
jgi:hypothetical protein